MCTCIFEGSIQEYQQMKHFDLHVLLFIQRDEQLNALESWCQIIACANKMIWGKTTKKCCAGAADRGILIGAGRREASEEIFWHLFLSFPWHPQSQQGQNIHLWWKLGGFRHVEPHAPIPSRCCGLRSRLTLAEGTSWREEEGGEIRGEELTDVNGLSLWLQWSV